MRSDIELCRTMTLLATTEKEVSPMVDPDIASRGSSFKQSVSHDQERQLSLLLMPTSAAATAAAHDPGGKVRLTLKSGVAGTAEFGGVNQEYRYRLTRVWDEGKPRVLFVMMNPSTADPTVDDPTVAKCCRFAGAWGYGGIFVGNSFAYRATDQKQLMAVSDPIGPENDRHLIAMAKAAATVVFAYGEPHKRLRYRGPDVARLLMSKAGVKPYALRFTKAGAPCHPLYLPETLKPIVWKL
jgi:hypothetical protein